MKIKFTPVNFPDTDVTQLVNAIRAAYEGKAPMPEDWSDQEIFNEWLHSSLIQLYKLWLWKNDPELVASNKKWRDLDRQIVQGDKTKIPEKNIARREFDVVVDKKIKKLNDIYTRM